MKVSDNIFFWLVKKLEIIYETKVKMSCLSRVILIGFFILSRND